MTRSMSVGGSTPLAHTALATPEALTVLARQIQTWLAARNTEAPLPTLPSNLDEPGTLVAQTMLDLAQHLRSSETDLLLQQAWCDEEMADLDHVLSGVLGEKEYLLYSANAAMDEFIFLSPLARQWLGLDQPDMLHSPQGWLKLVHPEDYPAVKAAFDGAASGQGAELEYRVVLPDGQVRWHCNHFHPVREPGDGGVRVNGIISDVTEVKRREKMMMDFAFRQEVIFTLTPDCFATFDLSGNLTYANPPFEKLVNITIGDLTGVGLPEAESMLNVLLTDKSPRFELCRWVQKLQQKPDDFGFEFDFAPMLLNNLPVLELQGKPNRYLEITLFNAGSETTATVLQLRDITQQHQVEMIKSEFLSTAAHELRTPMASIMGFAELLRLRDFPPETVRDILDTILRQSRRMTGLLNELLDLARIEARGGKDIHLQPLDFAEVLQDSVKAINQNDYSAKILPAELPKAMVNADVAKLQQALLNVLSNALKYSPQGGEITLSFDFSRAGWVALHVADQGIGMTEEQLARVFERFYRADDSGSIPGTGLGMSLVKEIIELHSGEIKLHSIWGQGTTVSLWLPLLPI
ncbi:PAS domain-containing sensor histidine kinase [Chitinibacter sp. ZOR0017]|uniref:PAS domain-containing sensor histidine kinase n=1 Tax=Chitinibacter sp. ZOR0017 TaxID=1339254 RepID=UPI0009E06A7D|nr:PAS domain-containing sensor histidine kinase [Chitinibacter sp. ZOR0017]